MQRFDEEVHLNKAVSTPGQPELPTNSREQEMIRSCLNGDRKAQKSLYDSLASKMFSVCIRYMGDRESAEDILQEGFVTLFSKLGNYSGLGSFEGWARRIFVNTALMCLRRNDVLKISGDLETARSLGSDTATQIQGIGYKEIIKFVSSLPPGYRTVFNLFVVEGYSHKEIGQMMGISENTSRSQLQRARMMLQEMIKG